ncbi:MAG: D-aminoacyl-tRNA deacylase [Eubacteriales bacterium]|nr:D-aminoacyl-tRNA deacylase [bacterium]MDY2793116.1 D-aminoacyl-tRNA deacylase [Eubacteriales bacterium]
MRCVVQRVTRSRVTVDGEETGRIERGFMVLVGAQEGDTQADMDYCVKKICGLRIFEDENDKMNLSLKDVGGRVLLVSQFTLLGDARHGNRPSFSNAARPEAAAPVVEQMKAAIEAQGIPVETGRFQTHMMVELVNDGPVTILLDSRKDF